MKNGDTRLPHLSLGKQARGREFQKYSSVTATGWMKLRLVIFFAMFVPLGGWPQDDDEYLPVNSLRGATLIQPQKKPASTDRTRIVFDGRIADDPTRVLTRLDSLPFLGFLTVVLVLGARVIQTRSRQRIGRGNHDELEKDSRTFRNRLLEAGLQSSSPIKRAGFVSKARTDPICSPWLGWLFYKTR